MEPRNELLSQAKCKCIKLSYSCSLELDWWQKFTDRSSLKFGCIASVATTWKFFVSNQVVTMTTLPRKVSQCSITHWHPREASTVRPLSQKALSRKLLALILEAKEDDCWTRTNWQSQGFMSRNYKTSRQNSNNFKLQITPGRLWKYRIFLKNQENHNLQANDILERVLLDEQWENVNVNKTLQNNGPKQSSLRLRTLNRSWEISQNFWTKTSDFPDLWGFDLLSHVSSSEDSWKYGTKKLSALLRLHKNFFDEAALPFQ